ncbi:hypothetical protein F2Q69_00030382 [Brassica cretica]|uniref:Aspartic peptidase DDI1-type domain-containing protein n=1 Tax=Brassica cretica TaxID=69181 RepID=A0A8S9S8S7_BRACR|nr:hypothetical protein F2Q69_00030382 [Brassica cretica]
MDELTAKVDQLLKNNQGHVFSMEQATTRQIQNQNQRQPQSNRQAVLATGNNQPDELKGLGLMFSLLKQLRVSRGSKAQKRNTEQPASSGATAPSEPAETPPVQVYVPKVPYPILPKHLMNPISAEQLAGFRKMMRRLPKNISFEHAWEIRPLHMFFKNCRESQEEIKALFTKALTPSLKVLPKVDDPGKFVFPCSIAGVEFKEALCDSRSSVNLVSKAIVDELGIVDVEPSQVGDCVLHTKFQVVEMRKDHEMPLIFGRSFMATVGVIVDMPNKRVSFSNINKKVFYKAVPARSQIRYTSCISVVNWEQPKIVPKKFGDKSEIKEVLDGYPHTDTKKLSGNAKVNEKVQKKSVKGDLMMTLIPRLCDEKSIEYEVKCKGTSKPFSKVRVILTHEVKEKGEADVKGLLSRVLKLNMSDCGAYFGTSHHDQPD